MKISIAHCITCDRETQHRGMTCSECGTVKQLVQPSKISPKLRHESALIQAPRRGQWKIGRHWRNSIATKMSSGAATLKSRRVESHEIR